MVLRRLSAATGRGAGGGLRPHPDEEDQTDEDESDRSLLVHNLLIHLEEKFTQAGSKPPGWNG